LELEAPRHDPKERRRLVSTETITIAVAAVAIIGFLWNLHRRW